MIAKEKHVLVVFPHPDDEAFGVSGTIATHIQMGTGVTYACLTLGEMGRNLGNPPFATRESLPEIRKRELRGAAHAMGLTDLRMMGLRDKTIEFEDDEKMVDMIKDLIDDVSPSLVITFYPDYCVHPDHEATARAVVRAVGRMPEAERPKLHCVAFANNTQTELGPPDTIHHVEAVQDIKLNTMRAHLSQTAWMLKDLEKRLADQDPEAIKWVTEERFYTYRFDQGYN
ncbi:bacillithiol biosynthesis deacetylase BshB2 [Jeotgalibacillus proteolyticus]|uniref:Bacillithiol biosynthesis deacetylase BshB2 n=1 Tax=Jeotgalibacillus proteolyticus TaxID=2082395 RepID=A0A2S5G9Q7_9BACL|nr:bacillithiol biosynthesis deacetylase BshB2 [Jeotgalibacillus proteolyticus]PPA69709.1 bacillithiol biosynthesis deacetylase BshB2 [Jeotgalibacillus proteolyticus]